MLTCTILIPSFGCVLCSSKDKRDIDVIKEHHRFLWKDSDDADTWEKQLAKKYYDKLYKEYTICDLSRYKENKVFGTSCEYIYVSKELLILTVSMTPGRSTVENRKRIIRWQRAVCLRSKEMSRVRKTQNLGN